MTSRGIFYRREVSQAQILWIMTSLIHCVTLNNYFTSVGLAAKIQMCSFIMESHHGLLTRMSQPSCVEIPKPLGPWGSWTESEMEAQISHIQLGAAICPHSALHSPFQWELWCGNRWQAMDYVTLKSCLALTFCYFLIALLSETISTANYHAVLLSAMQNTELCK